jgi:hypothetical protein
LEPQLFVHLNLVSSMKYMSGVCVCVWISSYPNLEWSKMWWWFIWEKRMCIRKAKCISLAIKHTFMTSGVSHCVTLPFTLKCIWRQKKNYANSNIPPFININLQKNPLKENQNPSRYHNYVTNLKFQHKPKYHLSKILI